MGTLDKVEGTINTPDNFGEGNLVIDGPFNFVQCAHGASECCVSATCPTRVPLQALLQRLYEFMDSVTLESIIQHRGLQPV
jgi:DNA-binding IscR family transcriptional regulator